MDLTNPNLSTPKSRQQYADRVEVLYLVKAYFAVSEMKQKQNMELYRCIETQFKLLVEKDEMNLSTDLKTQVLKGCESGDGENMWRRAKQHKRIMLFWYGMIPDPLPSGTPTVDKYLPVLQGRLYEDKKNKPANTMPPTFEPGKQWPAFMILHSHPKICGAASSNDNEEKDLLRNAVKSRSDQRKEEKKQEKHAKKQKVAIANEASIGKMQVTERLADYKIRTGNIETAMKLLEKRSEYEKWMDIDMLNDMCQGAIDTIRRAHAQEKDLETSTPAKGSNISTCRHDEEFDSESDNGEKAKTYQPEITENDNEEDSEELFEGDGLTIATIDGKNHVQSV